MTGVQRVAAYNVCVDPHGRLLVVRLSPVTQAAGRWNLPGGGIDFGEHPEAAAIRELREETGLGGRVVALLGVDSFLAEHRPAADEPGFVDYHAVRIIYRTEVEDGPLVFEEGGSTDAAAWCTQAELAARPLTKTTEFALRFVWPAP